MINILKVSPKNESDNLFSTIRVLYNDGKRLTIGNVEYILAECFDGNILAIPITEGNNGWEESN